MYLPPVALHTRNLTFPTSYFNYTDNKKKKCTEVQVYVGCFPKHWGMKCYKMNSISTLSNSTKGWIITCAPKVVFIHLTDTEDLIARHRVKCQKYKDKQADLVLDLTELTFQCGCQMI